MKTLVTTDSGTRFEGERGPRPDQCTISIDDVVRGRIEAILDENALWALAMGLLDLRFQSDRKRCAGCDFCRNLVEKGAGI